MRIRKHFLKGTTSIAVLFLLSMPLLMRAQGSRALLERTITVSFTQEPLDMALRKIAREGGFTFSYNSALVNSNRLITMSFTATPVREILDKIFQGTIQYKARNKYIILTKATASSSSKDARFYTGYVVDEATGQRLKNVSVYDPVSLNSTITDSYGYFEIKIDKPSPNLILAVNKANYTDTLVAVTDKNGLMKIPIHIDKEKMRVLADSVKGKLKRFWETKIMQSINTANVSDTLYRKQQFSLVPFVGTNHKLSGSVVNDYSYNIFGGVAKGVNKFELGGIFNIDRGDVKGWQLAGALNAVGGRVKGVQMAGLINAVKDSVAGVQFAGLINADNNSSGKFSAAGLFNYTHRQSYGWHLAGLGNMTIGEQKGPHLAGLFNFSTHDAGPAQVAGLLNFSGGKMNGAQLAGLLNFAARDAKGAQVAGLLNVAGSTLEGAQVSGLLNYATRVKGTQVGLINISDTIHGVPVGLFSFVLKGYHKIEFSADEIFYTNVAFRTGVHQFYNIFTAGAKPNTFKGEETTWTFGYGVGTAPRLNRWLSLNVDLTSNQVLKGNTIEGVNMINKVFVGVEMEPIRKVALVVGVTLNGYVTDTKYSNYPELFTDYTPNIFYDHTYNNGMNMKMWLGGKIGLRFL